MTVMLQVTIPRDFPITKQLFAKGPSKDLMHIIYALLKVVEVINRL